MRSSTAYHTVSHAALCVLTGTRPVYFTVELRVAKYETKKKYQQERYETRSRARGTSVFSERIKAVEEGMEKNGGKKGIVIRVIIGLRGW